MDYVKFGKTGLGGLAVDDTGTYMYTVGLASRQLYRIRIPANGASPTPAQVRIKLPEDVRGRGIQFLVSNAKSNLAVKQNWATFEVKSILDHEIAVIQ